MSNAAILTAKTLIRWKQAESNLNWLPARDQVASAAGVAPGSLRRLFSGTLKDTSKVGRALDDLLIETGRRKIAAIEHEMALARARGASSAEVDAGRVEALLAEARSLLAREVQG